MKTSSIYIQNLCVPCENRCRYCLLSYNGKLLGIDYQRSEAYTKRFYDWIGENRPDLSFGFYFGYSMEHPNLPEALAFLQSIGSPSGEFLQFDGMKLRTPGQTKDFLLMLKNHGVKLINLTFYGTRAYHDLFAARKGDYDFMVSVLQKANEIGLPTAVDMPLSHENISQIDEFFNEMDRYDTERINLFVPHSEGRGAALDDVRFSLQDYEAMGDRAKLHLNRKRFQTEGEWITQNTFSTPEKRVLTVSLTPGNIEFFEKQSFAETIAYLERLDDAYYRTIPSLPELARLYGNPNGEKFYSERDLYLCYQRRYIKENHIDIYDINDERQCFSRRI